MNSPVFWKRPKWKMKMREAVLESAYIRENSEDAHRRKARANRWQFVLIISISIGLLFSVAGLFISGLAYLGLVEHAKLLSRIGTIMIVVSAPLFILSAHCLDEIRFETKSEKKERYFGEFGKKDSDSKNLSL